MTIRGTTLRHMALIECSVPEELIECSVPEELIECSVPEELIECSVPEELLVKRESAYDGPDAFGVDVAYFLGETRVALYAKRIPKINTFAIGQTDPGFDGTGKVVTFPVEDHPGEFVSIIEARIGNEITNRGVHIMKKFGALAEMSQGSF